MKKSPISKISLAGEAFFHDYDMVDVDSRKTLCQYVYAIYWRCLCCRERRPNSMHKSERRTEVDGWKMSEKPLRNVPPAPGTPR